MWLIVRRVNIVGPLEDSIVFFDTDIPYVERIVNTQDIVYFEPVTLPLLANDIVTMGTGIRLRNGEHFLVQETLQTIKDALGEGW
jgi:hypothetical protein